MRIDCALNIILIGMPGAGKSTVGVLLAKRLGYNFIDTDLLLQSQQKCRLQQIIANKGLESFQSRKEILKPGRKKRSSSNSPQLIAWLPRGGLPCTVSELWLA